MMADTTTANAQVRSLSETVRLDARTKLLNPKFYEGMLASGYEGTREITKRLRNTMGWSATAGEVDNFVYEDANDTLDTTTGDSLTAQDAPVILERMDFPDPVIKIAIEPKTKGDLEKMGTGLQKLAAEDPSFHYSRDEETNQTVIEGMGELHLEILVDRLKREFNVECDVGAPQVNYRESISKPATVKYTHKKQSGGSGQFADRQVHPQEAVR